jgi:hypothetical protein
MLFVLIRDSLPISAVNCVLSEEQFTEAREDASGKGMELWRLQDAKTLMGPKAIEHWLQTSSGVIPNLDIRDVAEMLQEYFDGIAGPGQYSVGCDLKNTIYAYRKNKKPGNWTLPDWFPSQFQVVEKFTGKFEPA